MGHLTLVTLGPSDLGCLKSGAGNRGDPIRDSDHPEDSPGECMASGYDAPSPTEKGMARVLKRALDGINKKRVYVWYMVYYAPSPAETEKRRQITQTKNHTSVKTVKNVSADGIN